MSNIESNSQICTQSNFNDLSKEELIQKVQKLVAQNNNLKNIISKSSVSKCQTTSCESKTSCDIKKKKFDFTKWNKRHILLKIMYLGWDYHGFASQDTMMSTIEGILFPALKKCCLIENRETSNYHRCGRTDKGVSSFGQVVSLNVRSRLSQKGINKHHTKGELLYIKMLNKILPKEINVIAWSPVEENFSARFECKERTYKYFFPRGNLNIEVMNSAAQRLIGTHDFRNFCKMDVSNGVLNYIRHISSIEISVYSKEAVGDEISGYDICVLTIVGKAFLWHQVRCIMGVLILIGQGLENPDVIDKLLDIESNPRKPQYNMAHEIPLNLFQCSFDTINWIFEEDELKFSIRNMQKIWTLTQTRASMVHIMLLNLESLLPSQFRNQEQPSFLLQGVKRKVYQPLFNRPTCESLENRIEHHSKKRRLNLDVKELKMEQNL